MTKTKRLRAATAKPTAANRPLVLLWLDPDVVAHYRRTGRGWQSRINAALRKAAK